MNHVTAWQVKESIFQIFISVSKNKNTCEFASNALDTNNGLFSYIFFSYQMLVPCLIGLECWLTIAGSINYHTKHIFTDVLSVVIFCSSFSPKKFIIIWISYILMPVSVSQICCLLVLDQSELCDSYFNKNSRMGKPLISKTPCMLQLC